MNFLVSAEDLHLPFKKTPPPHAHIHTCHPSTRWKLPSDFSVTNINTRGEKARWNVLESEPVQKKKLKYNLKLFKFGKASQVLFSCQENAIIGRLWVTSQGGVERET